MCRSTCFGRLHAHHQERTNALTASGFTLERNGRSVVGRPRPTTLLPSRSKVKPEAANAVVSWERPKHVERHINFQVINLWNCCIWLVSLFEYEQWRSLEMYALRLSFYLMSLTNCSIAYENLYACKSETFFWRKKMGGITKNCWFNNCRHYKYQHPVYHLSRHEFPSFENYVKMQIA
jgi:hypothetical protein